MDIVNSYFNEAEYNWHSPICIVGIVLSALRMEIEWEVLLVVFPYMSSIGSSSPSIAMESVFLHFNYYIEYKWIWKSMVTLISNILPAGTLGNCNINLPNVALFSCFNGYHTVIVKLKYWFVKHQSNFMLLFDKQPVPYCASNKYLVCTINKHSQYSQDTD